MRLYLDIETYRPEQKDAWTKEKIIAIGALADWTSYSSTSLQEKVQPSLFTEWRLGSKLAVLKAFYDDLRSWLDEACFIVVVGFNILRMDIPLLIQRAVKYNIENLEELNKLWHNTFTIDLFQQLLLANRNRFRGLSLSNVYKFLKSLNVDCHISVEEHGAEVAKAYENKEHDKIEQWLIEDIEFCRWLELSGTVTRLIKESMEQDRSLFENFSKS